MSSMYDELGASPAVTIAALTENAHRNTPGQTGTGCGECTPHGCPRMEWAAKVLAEHRKARAEFLGRDRA